MVHPRCTQDRGIDREDVAHRAEGRATGDQLAADAGTPPTELEEAIDRRPRPIRQASPGLQRVNDIRLRHRARASLPSAAAWLRGSTPQTLPGTAAPRRLADSWECTRQGCGSRDSGM